MALQVGIIGLPNVGKSTLFNALTANEAETANYPFCTIDPNVGVVPVPDDRLTKISQLIKPSKTIPTVMEFVDIAGLVQGASQGKGAGNQFLSHIRNTQALLHVVRCFEDEDIIHVDGTIDPLKDIETINTELLLSDLEQVEKRLSRIKKNAKGSKEFKQEQAFLEKLLENLNNMKSVRVIETNEKEKEFLKNLPLLTLKPVLYVCNVNEKDLKSNKPELTNSHIKAVQEKSLKEKSQTLLVCSKLEAELASWPLSDKKEFLKQAGLKEPSLYRLIRESYKLLNLITYFTAGPKEARAWTISKGTQAPQAAGVIHSDFERGFICAEVFSCQDLFINQTENTLKEKGLIRKEGKNYEVQDGDVILFRFNV